MFCWLRSLNIIQMAHDRFAVLGQIEWYSMIKWKKPLANVRLLIVAFVSLLQL